MVNLRVVGTWLATTLSIGVLSLYPEDRRSAANAAYAPLMAAAYASQASQTLATRPELVLQVGRTEGISCVAMSPDGSWLASGGYGGPVRIWDPTTGHELRLLTSGADRTLDLAISPDGKLLAAASQDGKVRVWEVVTGRKVLELAGANPQSGAQTYGMNAKQAALLTPEMKRLMEESTHGVWRVAFSANGRWLASGSQDGMVKVWEVVTSRQVVSWQSEGGGQPGSPTTTIKAVGFSSESGRAQALSSTPRGEVEVSQWDLASGRQEHQTRINVSFPSGLSFSPSSRHMAIVAVGGGVAVWDTETGKLVRTLGQVPEQNLALALSGDGRLLAAAYGKNDTFLSLGASSGANRFVKVWDVETGKERFTLRSDAGTVNALAFSADGRQLITGSTKGRLNFWDTATGQETRALAAEGRPVEALAFSHDGRLLFAGTTQTVNLWEVSSGSSLQTAALPEGTQVIGPGTFADNGFALPITPADHSKVEIWEALAGKEVQSFARTPTEEAPQAALAKENHLLAVVEDQQGSDMLSSFTALAQQATGSMYDASGKRKSAKELMKEMRKNKNAPQSQQAQQAQQAIQQLQEMAKQMQSSGNDPSKMVGMLLGTSKIQLQEVGGSGSGVVQGLSGRATAIALSQDGRLLAAGEQNGVVQVFDVNSGNELKNFKTATAGIDRPVLVFSPDGHILAAGGLADTVTLWELSSDRPPRTFASHMLASSLAFSDDGGYLAAASLDGTIVLHDVASGRELHTMSGAGASTSIAFSPDNRWLASGNREGATQFWEVKSGTLAATATSVGDRGDWLVVTPDGLFDGSPAAWDRILWRFSGNTFDVAPVEIFFSEFFYPGLLGDVLSGKRPKAAVDISQKDRRSPVVEIRMAADQPSDARHVKVKVQVSEVPADQSHAQGSGVRDVRLFRNGSLVKLWPDKVKLDASGKAELEATIPVVAGDNRLSAYAFNSDNIKSADASLTVTGDKSLKRPGKAYILVIGIDHYANPDYNLNYAVADAKAVGAELATQQAKAGDVGSVQLVPLLDQDATKANIVLALDRLRGQQNGPLPDGAPAVLEKLQASQPEDEVFVYFAGHGTALGPHFYLIPEDLGYPGKRTELDEAGLRLIESHSISDVDLESALRILDAREILLIIDACNSGQALEAEEKRRGPMNSKGLAQLAYEKGMYVLTAAQGYQAALEVKELGHGLLTFALVEEGLKTDKADVSPKDGQVVAREWLDYATLRVPQLQETLIEEARKQGREIFFLEGDQQARGSQAKHSLQRPRVFYRRELQGQPFVIARVVANGVT